MRKWPLISLGEILVNQEKRPDSLQVATGKIKIVSKMRFSDGGVELPSGASTKTELIQCDPDNILVSGINASQGAIGNLEKPSPVR